MKNFKKKINKKNLAIGQKPKDQNFKLLIKNKSNHELANSDYILSLPNLIFEKINFICDILFALMINKQERIVLLTVKTKLLWYFLEPDQLMEFFNRWFHRAYFGILIGKS